MNLTENQTYINEDIGLAITFPESVEEFVFTETHLGPSGGTFPIFEIQFGRNKDDFSLDNKHKGNLLSVSVFDKTFCQDPRIDELKKDFCETHRDDDSKGSWEGYFEKDSQDLSYWIAPKRLLYQFDVNGSDELRNNEKKSFIEQLEIKARK